MKKKRILSFVFCIVATAGLFIGMGSITAFAVEQNVTIDGVNCKLDYH